MHEYYVKQTRKAVSKSCMTCIRVWSRECLLRGTGKHTPCMMGSLLADPDVHGVVHSHASSHARCHGLHAWSNNTHAATPATRSHIYSTAPCNTSQHGAHQQASPCMRLSLVSHASSTVRPDQRAQLPASHPQQPRGGKPTSLLWLSARLKPAMLCCTSWVAWLHPSPTR
jgi:hypothetical protein